MSIEDLTFPKHYAVGQTYVKELHLEFKGDKVLSHAHEFDHLSLLAVGHVAVTVEGVRKEYHGPTALTIHAHKRHEIEALRNNCLWYCVHTIPAELRGEDLLDAAVKAGA